MCAFKMYASVSKRMHLFSKSEIKENVIQYSSFNYALLCSKHVLVLAR